MADSMGGTMGDTMPAPTTNLEGHYEIFQQWESVTHGRHALDELPRQLAAHEAERVMLVTTPSIVRQREVLELVQRTLGDCVVGTFGECVQFVPRSTVLRAAQMARSCRPDALVSLGGGSVVDTARGVALALAAEIASVDDFDDHRMLGYEIDEDFVTLFALPTTLSAAEYTCLAGITDERTGDREPYRRPIEFAARSVILDPRLTRATPDRLWRSTGIKALTDAYEQHANGSAGPVMEPLTERAVAWLVRDLDGADDDARLRCQLASWLSLFGTLNAGTKVGIAAAIRHQLGRLGVAHGLATCALLTEVAKRSPVSFLSSADAAALLERLGLPARLRELGVERAALDGLSVHVAEDFAAKRTARTYERAEILDILEHAW